VKVGVILPLFSGDAEKVLAAAREAEELGYDGAFVFDHLFPPGAPSDRPALEAFSTLAAVAAATHRMTIGTLVTRAGLRPTGLLAKMGAWLDAASGGRLVLGIGTGDPIDRGEHLAYGIPMRGKAERREHLREVLAALKGLFGGAPYTGGRFVPAIEGPLAPPPARSGGPPIWVGAQAEEVVRIAAELADGWNGWGLDVETFGLRARLLSETAGEVGRGIDQGRPMPEATWSGIALVASDRRELEDLLARRRARGLTDAAWTGTADDLVEFMEGLGQAGATWSVLVLAGPPDRRRLVAERVLPAVGKTAPSRTAPNPVR
jgi:alkanesulfonate monooxygenase SsuD/methylene tetrahydromethanopterin reductase-like flavin-dependent oxidoreductase (luciferase family)